MGIILNIDNNRIVQLAEQLASMIIKNYYVYSNMLCSIKSN